MPNTAIALRFPPSCEQCGREGLVRLQQTITGPQIVLHWTVVAVSMNGRYDVGKKNLRRNRRDSSFNVASDSPLTDRPVLEHAWEYPL
jgi:hypothetical protein